MIELLTGGGLIVDLTILSKKQIEIVETLKKSVLLNSSFYLAGGTGLALILAHRKSIDFDFFSKAGFSPEKILEQLRENIKENQISLAEMKEDTLIVFLKNIQASFFYYNYPLIKPLIPKNGLSVASVEDISAMKVISLIQRGLKKDFVDLWAIIRQTEYSLKDIFSFCKEKYGSAFSESIAIKALTYFQDAEEEEMPEGIKYKFPWDDIKKDLTTFTREYFNQYLQ